MRTSAGRSAVDPKVEWTRLDGAFRRFPLGMGKVGQIAATGEPIEALDLLPEPPDWAADPAWMRAEGIAGFGGQPLVHRGEVLGVLGVFARGAVGPDCMDWLRAIADGAAAAIATARAFEWIEELSRRLEQENEYLEGMVAHFGAVPTRPRAVESRRTMTAGLVTPILWARFSTFSRDSHRGGRRNRPCRCQRHCALRSGRPEQTAINRLRSRRTGAAYDQVAASTRAVDRLGGTH